MLRGTSFLWGKGRQRKEAKEICRDGMDFKDKEPDFAEDRAVFIPEKIPCTSRARDFHIFKYEELTIISFLFLVFFRVKLKF